MSKRCERCGKENYDDAKICLGCGALLEEKKPWGKEDKKNIFFGKKRKSDAPKEKKPMSKRKKVAIGVIVAFVALFLLVMCSGPSVEEIYATYDGDCSEGVVLDSQNDDITVIGVDEEGNETQLSGWSIDDPVTLEADKESTVEIRYGNVTCDLDVECSTTEMEYFEVEYDGDHEAGTMLDNWNDGIIVTAYYANGDEEVVDDWYIEDPKTLEEGKTTEVEIEYEDQVATLSVSSIESISASYDGSRRAGVWLSKKNDGIHVKAKYSDGTKEKVSGWKIVKKKRLQAGKSSEVTIEYGGKTCTLNVQCSTLSESQYKESCKSISYDSLARDPDTYEGEKVKFYGRIVQVQEESGFVAMRINVTNSGYGYYDDTVLVRYLYKDNESKFLEDDMVTFYGEADGLCSYTSVMGAQITIPEVYAKYISR